MKCKDCLYGKEDFDRRMDWYNQIISEHGIPNDIYGDLQQDEVAEEFEQFVWCNKVGGKVYCFGHCSEWYEPDNEEFQKISRKKKRNKHERYLKHKSHLKRLYEDDGPVFYTDDPLFLHRGCKDRKKPYYYQFYRGKRSKYLKKISNKKIRRYKGELHNGYQHIHKLYDFWWEYD